MKKPCNAATYRRAVCDFIEEKQARRVVEVGVYSGVLSRMIVECGCVESLTIIDSWRGEYCGFGQAHMNAIASGVIEWASRIDKVNVIRVDAVDGARLFSDGWFDLYHTDGDHSFEGCSADIRAWMPKIRSGGWITGDNFEKEGVAAAVKGLAPNYHLRAKGRLWIARV